MPKSNQINVKVNDPTNEAIEEFAEKYDYNKAEACRRMIEDRLTGEGHLNQNRTVPDGGQIKAQLDGLDEQLGELDEELDTVRTETVRTQQIIGSLLIGVVGVVVWSVGVLGFNVPLLVSIATGALLVLYIAYFLLALRGHIND